jgi:hypothetical protein
MVHKKAAATTALFLYAEKIDSTTSTTQKFNSPVRLKGTGAKAVAIAATMATSRMVRRAMVSVCLLLMMAQRVASSKKKRRRGETDACSQNDGRCKTNPVVTHSFDSRSKKYATQVKWMKHKPTYSASLLLAL